VLYEVTGKTLTESSLLHSLQMFFFSSSLFCVSFSSNRIQGMPGTRGLTVTTRMDGYRAGLGQSDVTYCIVSSSVAHG
jgi:hypothetical protein